MVGETPKDYLKYSKKVNQTFGNMPPNYVKPEHIRKYMDLRETKSRTQANREKAFMSRVYRWALREDLLNLIHRQFKAVARTRYITDDEYNALYSCSPDVVKIAMELAYLCCDRQGDILEMKKSQVTDKGIFIQQSKTAVSQIKTWSERLEIAVNMAYSLPLNGVDSIYLIHQQSGSRYTRDAFNAQWMKAKNTAKDKFPGMAFDFTFHDLQAKGLSDFDGMLSEKQAISEHKRI